MKKIAIIGGGIAGLGAAYLLGTKHEVTLFEKNDYAGGHARTRTVDYDGEHIAVDTGFIVYNNVNYPHLKGLFKALGVATQASNMSFGFTENNGAFEWAAMSINSIFGQRRNIFNPSFYRVLKDVRTFFKAAPDYKDAPENLTLGALLQQLGMSTAFQEKFILPMGAAIWSCPSHTMLAFPARTFIQFFENHGLLSMDGQHQWHTVTGGSKNYVAALLKQTKAIVRLHTPITSVQQQGEQVKVTTEQGEITVFDEVIFAAHADETLQMLNDANEDEQRVLGAFGYETNRIFLHRDIRVMPKRKRCWASWVYSARDNGSGQKISVTYWMNKLQNIMENKPLFVTLNPAIPPAKELVFEEHTFTHPIFNSAAIAAQREVPTIQGKRHLWFCGAYQRYGFHEDGLASAVLVASALGVVAPWEQAA